jgi:hypothetical protein
VKLFQNHVPEEFFPAASGGCLESQQGVFELRIKQVRRRHGVKSWMVKGMKSK